MIGLSTRQAKERNMFMSSTMPRARSRMSMIQQHPESRLSSVIQTSRIVVILIFWTDLPSLMATQSSKSQLWTLLLLWVLVVTKIYLQVRTKRTLRGAKALYHQLFVAKKKGSSVRPAHESNKSLLLPIPYTINTALFPPQLVQKWLCRLPLIMKVE